MAAKSKLTTTASVVSLTTFQFIPLLVAYVKHVIPKTRSLLAPGPEFEQT